MTTITWTQLPLFPPPEQPEQLTLTYTERTTMTPTTRPPARGLFAHFRNRFGGPRRPHPSSTPELTPDDWRTIKLALETAERDHTAHERWPAAEAAHNVRRKLG